MSANAVVIIAIGESKEWEICRPSVLKYCEKNNLQLEIITTMKYNIEPFEPFFSINLFEKNQVYELFDKYERILRLDYDLIIAPNCPNLFEIVPKNKIGGVFEDVGIAEIDRKRQMINIQESLGNLNWESGYINAGVVIASRQHKEIFNTSVEEINTVQKINDITTPEQDYLNYMIQKLGFEIYSLDYKFNHIRYFSPDRFDSYIIHYAGSMVFDYDLMVKQYENKDKRIWRDVTAEQMKRDYEVLYNEM